MIDINQVWPEWNEDCVLGEGSFGKVYRAKRVEYGRTFYSAIKVISVPKTQQEVKNARTQGMTDSDIYYYFQSLVDNLLNEITLMDNLKGANNIVGIDDYRIIEHEGEIGWDIFIRMELLSPFDSFASNPQFTQKDVIRLGIDICTALETCEAYSIIHRDIKPDNIFVSRFGEYKLGDFGIARKLEATQANLSRKGTLNYMAPEIYKSEEYGASVDIYSLGLVLYTLLNNNRIAFLPPYPQPITYSDNEEALSKRLSGEPIPCPCNASESLGATVLKACAYRPEDRYATATEFKTALVREWNVLVQLGENKEINYAAMQGGQQYDNRLEHTTNDMTANGRIVVDEYAQGTTVISDGTDYNSSIYISEPISTVRRGKYNKVCRIISYPLAGVLIILAVALYSKSELLVDTGLAIAMMFFGVEVLIARFNKIAAGISILAIAAVSLMYGVDNIRTMINLGILLYKFPLAEFLSAISGIVMLVGGIIVITQKEGRLGGMLCVYSCLVEWIYYIYIYVNLGITVGIFEVCYLFAKLLAVMWAYGYDSSETVHGTKKVLGIIAMVLAGIAATIVVIGITAYMRGR